LQELFPGKVDYVPGLTFSREKRTDFSDVVAAARRADVVLVFLGEEAILSGEAHSLSDLNLQGAQSELIAAVKQSCKKVIVVVMAGRPLTIGRDLENCDAMLYSFHPGTMGGEAIAELLEGKAVPSGKSPVTFLKTAGQAPMYYNHFNTGRPNNGSETLLDDIPLKAGQTSLGCTSYYLDSGYGPLFPFGYGLSYTTFEYSNLNIDKSSYSAKDTIRVSVDLKNTGEYDATEVVQLYVRDLVGSVVRPVKELKGFQRVELKAGETKAVTFALPVADLAFWTAGNDYSVEPGDFQLWVAGDSATGDPVSFSVK
jgi:beta-glucosidase